MEHVKTNDAVYITANFYKPPSGESVSADTTPRWFVYEDGSATSMLDGTMSTRSDYTGMYYALFHASGVSGFTGGSFYDVQVSGEVDNIHAITSAKHFVLDDIFDANIVQVSGVDVIGGATADVNVVQVSGELVTLNDFKGGSVDTTGLATNEDLMAVSGSVLDVNVVQVSGIPVSGSFLDANVIQVSGELVTLNDFKGGSVDTTGLATNEDLMAISGSVLDANIVQVSGENVDIGWFRVLSNGVISSGTFDHITAYPIRQPDIDSTELARVGADGDTLELLSDQLDTVTNHLTGIKGAGWSSGTDTLEQIRNTIDSDHSTINSHLTDMKGGGWNSTYTLESIYGYNVALSGSVFDANIIQVSGVPVSGSVLDVNVVQVSGELVTLYDFRGGSVDTAGLATNEDIMSVSGSILDANIVQVSGIPVIGGATADVNVVQVSGELVTLNDFKGGSVDTTGLATTEDIIAVSGSVLDANIVQVSGVPVSGSILDVNTVQISGEYVDIGSFRLLSTGAISSGVYDHVTAYPVRSPDIDSTELARVGADSDTLELLSDQLDTVTNHLTDIKGAGWSSSTDTLEGIYDNQDTDSTTIINHLTDMKGASWTSTYTLESIYGYNVALSGSIMSADVVQVSGEQVTLNDFKTTFVDTDIYFANIRCVKDTTSNRDEYTVQWYKNDQPVSSGDLTTPAFSVYDTSDGSALVQHQLLNYASTNLGVVRHNETANVTASGEPYLVIASGVIDSALRDWNHIIGIDLL
jgi:hypothetical protein